MEAYVEEMNRMLEEAKVDAHAKSLGHALVVVSNKVGDTVSSLLACVLVFGTMFKWSVYAHGVPLNLGDPAATTFEEAARKVVERL